MMSVSNVSDFRDEVVHSNSTSFKLHLHCKATKIIPGIFWNLSILFCRSDDNIGWKSYFVENPTSFRDLPLQWDGDGKIPDWLSGTYVKNGPAQVREAFIKKKIR